MAEQDAWWRRYPGRLEWEIARLEAAGVRVTINERRRYDDGVMELALAIPDEHTGLGDLSAVATFPPAYPFLAPSVAVSSLQLGSHQHPFGHTLCLVGRGTSNWATTDSLAFLVTQQLRDAIALGSGGSTPVGREEDQGEPFSDYYTYRDNAMVLVDSAWVLPASATCGAAEVRVAGQLDLRSPAPITFLVKNLAEDAGSPLAGLDPEVLEVWPYAAPVTGRWSTLDAPVRDNHPDAVWEAAERADRRVAVPSFTANGLEVQMRLVGFPEEHARGRTGLGWLLLVRARPHGQPGKTPRKRARSGNPAKAHPWETWMVRAGRAGRGDLAARVPARDADLRDRRVAIIGAGALGSVIVEHLARAGVGSLDVFDKDVIEPGNATRHACTIVEAGQAKAGAVAGLARRINPYVNVTVWPGALGQTVMASDARSAFMAMLRRVDVVVDASAEMGVQAMTADLARRSGVTWLSAEAVNGAWGGTVVTIPGDADWCRDCLMWHYEDGVVPVPQEDPAPLGQPIGCAEPTFTGTAADLAVIAAQAARAVLNLLTGWIEPGADIVELRRDGVPILPTWSHFPPSVHPRCRH